MRKPDRHRRVLLLTLVLGAGLCGVDASADDITDQRWRAGDCPFEVADDFTVGSDVICGTVTVPERHAEPDGPKITLSVAIFRTLGDSPAPDPLALFSGGPGANIFEFAPTKSDRLFGRILSGRDLVLMSERGTYGAEPFLDCPELAVLDHQFGVWGEARDALELEAYTECKERLVSEGIRLESFNSAERAADVPFVMEVLGYREYNLWGVSGGGLLTLLVARDHADTGVRTIMPDSGTFPRADFREVFAPLFTNVSARYRLLFSSCAADATCSADFPNLEEVFLDLVRNLDANPVQVPIKNPATGETVAVDLTGDLFVAVLTNSFGLIGMVPKMIFDTADGDYDLLSLFLPGAVAGDSGIGYADSLYVSMICPEIGGMTLDDVVLDGTYPEIVRALSPKVQLFFDICSLWGLPTVPLGEVVSSDVPALIMEGAFDTNKPPGYGAEVAANFRNGFLVEFGDKAHGVLGECALSMMNEFMNDPTRRPDTGCVAERVTFSGPAGPLWWIVYSNLPWFVVGAVLVLIALGGGIVWWVRRRRSRSKVMVGG